MGRARSPNRLSKESDPATIFQALPRCPAQQIRSALYGGALFHASANAASRALAAWVREHLADGLAGELDAVVAGVADASTSPPCPVEAFESLGAARARIEDEGLPEPCLSLLRSLGFDPQACAIDRPRLRLVRPGAHELDAARPAYFAHRDTWYANPACQINIWLALHDTPASAGVGFFPSLFATSVANDSGAFDYQGFMAQVGWQSRGVDAQVKSIYPRALGPLDLGLRVSRELARGDVLLFSAHHLHATIGFDSGPPRFSLEFRIVDHGDHRRGLGPRLPDTRASGCAFDSYSQPPHITARRE